MKFLASLLCVLLVPLSVSADYQLEIRLLNYTNPGGRTDSGACCEPEAELRNACLDPCDTQFTIIVQNFRRLEDLGSPVVLEEFNDTDSISFPSCGVIGGMQNPLVVTFSASDYDVQRDDLRVTTNIADVDIHPVSRLKTTNPITSVIFEIPRRNFSETFTNITIGGTTLTNLQLVVQYRLICTPGSCGSTCSQTTACIPYSPACPPVQPVCSDATPCMNGGTCQNDMCRCTQEYTGDRCENVVVDPPPDTTASPSTTAATTTARTETMSTSTDREGGGTSTRSQGVSPRTTPRQGNSDTTTATLEEAFTNSQDCVVCQSKLMITLLVLFLCLYW